jgi:hypothetical protein
MEIDPDDDLIASITPDVMKCLARSGFFDELDDILCPQKKLQASKACRGLAEFSEHILTELKFTPNDLKEIFDVLRSKGGSCGCEILYNAAGSSRLKSEYWLSQAEKPDKPTRHAHQ